MRWFLLLLLSVVVSGAASAQVPIGAVSQVPRSKLPPTQRIQLLENEVQALTWSIDTLRTELKSTTEDLRTLLAKIARPDDKADDQSSADLWTIIRRLSDRICKDEPKPCP